MASPAFSYVVPLTDCELFTSAVERFDILRVSIVSAAELQRTDERYLGLVEELRQTDGPPIARALAVLTSGKKISEHQAMVIFERELAILQCLQLPLSCGRWQRASYFRGAIHPGSVSLLSFNSNGFHSSMVTCYPALLEPLSLSCLASDNVPDFREVLNFLETSGCASSWRKDIVRCLELLGKSLLSQDLLVSFLLSAIALETLFINDQVKHREQLERSVRLFTPLPLTPESKGRLKDFNEAYDKRCLFVHRGDSDGIRIKDVRLFQEICYNSLRNIARNPIACSSRGKVAALAARLSAAAILGCEQDHTLDNFSYKAATTVKSDPAPPMPHSSEPP